MADDPLTRFADRFKLRPAGPGAPPSPASVDRREAYEAFDAKDRAHAQGMDIRRAGDGGLSFVVMYNYLHHVAYDGDSWTRILLTVSGLTFEIRGRNLRRLVEAIRLRQCHAIQEYSKDRHILAEPVDAEAPFIESIAVEVLVGKAPRDSEKAG